MHPSSPGRPSPPWSPDFPSPPSAPRILADTSLAALEEKVLILERKLEIKEEVEATAKETAPEILVNYNDGFNLKSADDKFSLRQRGLLQIDYRQFFATNDSASQRSLQQRNLPNNFPSTFLVRKARPYFDVTLDKWASFRIMPDFGGGFQLLDAYAELAFVPELRLRAGKFTPPLGFERLQAASDNTFAEYGLTSNLHPPRDLGLQLTGDIANETFHYAVGVFNGAVDGANKEVDSTSHKDVDARVFIQPFKTGNIELLRNFGFGVAGSYGEKWGDSTASNLPAFRSAGQNTIFSYSTGARDSLTVQAKGAQYRVIPQAYWYAGSFSLLGEYAFSATEVNFGKRTDRSHAPSTTAPGWSTPPGSSPANPPPGAPSSPATPWARRASAPSSWPPAPISSKSTRTPSTWTSPIATRRVQKATAFGGGVNWYLSRFVRVTANYDYTVFRRRRRRRQGPRSRSMWASPACKSISKQNPNRFLHLFTRKEIHVFSQPEAQNPIGRPGPGPRVGRIRRRRQAAQRLLRSHPRALHRLQRRLRQALEDRPTGDDVTISQSHGGSGKQARSVIDGLDADVATLALAYDIDAICGTGRSCIPKNWQSLASPQQLAVHLHHRLPGAQGQSQGHQGLGRPGQARHLKVITPNPKTSGGARWNYLAAWGYALSTTATTPPRPTTSWPSSTRTCPCWTPAPAARPPPSCSAASATCTSPGRTRPCWPSRSWAPTRWSWWCPR